MHGTNQLLDTITMTLDNTLKVYINVFENSLSRKWLLALNELLKNNYHLEKNYCFLGFADGPRNGEYLCKQINKSIDQINQSKLGYHIDNYFSLENSIEVTYCKNAAKGQYAVELNREKFNQLHRYFEDLQGVSGNISPYYFNADTTTRWHIRQLNLLCHEFESWVLSYRKKTTLPEWQRPSQLMCWLNAPRFNLDVDDFDLFGIDTINRPLGGVFVGVNKAVGKHHWEVFVDEAKYDPTMIIQDLTTTTMRGQLEAAGDFDIEWANNPGNYDWQKKHLADFRSWLINNNFDPNDPSLTIGHPQVGQVDLKGSFGTEDYREIWKKLNTCLNVTAIETSDAKAMFSYHWSDADYAQRQIEILGK
jgi:hypothetical protein